MCPGPGCWPLCTPTSPTRRVRRPRAVEKGTASLLSNPSPILWTHSGPIRSCPEPDPVSQGSRGPVARTTTTWSWVPGSSRGGNGAPSPWACSRGPWLLQEDMAERPGGVDLGFLLLFWLTRGPAFWLTWLVSSPGLLFASQGRREAEAAAERQRATERAPAAGGAGPAPGLGREGSLGVGAGGRGTLEPQDLSPELRCTVLEAPEYNLRSITQQARR